VTSAVIEGLERAARERPTGVAVREWTAGELGRSFTWAELRAAAAALADRSSPGGRPPGSVLVCCGNRFEALVGIVGGLWAGGQVAPVAPESTPFELRELCKSVGARVAIGTGEALAALSGEVEDRISLDEVSAGARSAALAPAGGGGGAILLRSSGTTGPPKIVRRLAPALDVVGRNCRRAIGVDGDDVLLLAIPVYHSYGIDMGILTGLQAGSALELHDRFDATSVRTALMSGEASVFPAVPVMLDALGRATPAAVSPPRLRRVVSAGSPLSPEVAARFTRAFGVPVGQIYGATEFGSVAYNDPDAWDADRDGPFRPECVGRPFPGVRVRLDGEQVHVAAESMLDAYLDDPEPPTRDGFLDTGDLGRVDAEGRVYLTGRRKLMIDVGGLKVNPLEVEAILARHPAVRDVVVVPIPYSSTASRLKAIVIPEPDASLDREEIRAFAREHLIHYKVPRSFEIRTDVPRSPTGKILRQALMPDAEAR